MLNEKCTATGRPLASHVVLRIYSTWGMSQSSHVHELAINAALCGVDPLRDTRLCFAGGPARVE